MLGVPRLLSGPLGQGQALPRNRALWIASRYSPLRTHPGATAANGKRFKTIEAGDNKTGHIEAGPNEGIFFLSSMFARFVHIAPTHNLIDSRCLSSQAQFRYAASFHRCGEVLATCDETPQEPRVCRRRSSIYRRKSLTIFSAYPCH